MKRLALIVAVGQGTYAFAPAVFAAVGALGQSPSQAAAGDAPMLFLAAAIIQAAAIGCFLAGRRNHRRRPALQQH